LERRAIYRGVFTSVKELRDKIHRFIKVHNDESAKPFKWTKSAAAIIESVNKAKKLLAWIIHESRLAVMQEMTGS